MEAIGALFGLTFGWMMMVFWALALVVSLGGTVLWVWMLVEVLIRESDENSNRLIWALVIIFTHWLGALIYIIVRRRERVKRLGR